MGFRFNRLCLVLTSIFTEILNQFGAIGQEVKELLAIHLLAVSPSVLPC